LSSKVENTTSSYFYSGTEATTATDSNWSDEYNLQGANLKIIYDASMSTTSSDSFKLKLSGSSVTISGDITIS
jgi:hypothetical protein